MKNLKERIRNLDVNLNTQERLMYQVTDWSVIKYLLKNDAEPEILSAIDSVIECFIWLYEKGLSLYEFPIESCLTAEERLRYRAYQGSFSKVTGYLQNHMSLLGEFI